ncbi:MAG: PIN domain-containing protein [Spirochaetaceae bacterium]|nr:PIN domain-containing protein [Spirochaetaceae bacterium]
MSVFVDTSALYAALDTNDDGHARALEGWSQLITARTPLTTSNYVCVESAALLQARLGMEAVRAMFDDLLPIVTVILIDEAVHAQAVATFLDANRRRLSLVDCASFAVMRQHGISSAFAFDPHFEERGFQLV